MTDLNVIKKSIFRKIVLKFTIFCSFLKTACFFSQNISRFLSVSRPTRNQNMNLSIPQKKAKLIELMIHPKFYESRQSDAFMHIN
jgi:hypothetical protein